MWSSSIVLAVATSVLAVFLVSLYLFFTWNFDYWRKRNVPHNKPTPIVGSLNFLLRKSVSDWFIDEFARFPGADYYGIWLFTKPALVIRSPELARNIIVKDFVYFRNRFMSSGSSDPLGSLNIVTANDPLWSSMRKRLTPVFTSAKLRALVDMMNMYARETVERIRRDHVEQDKPVDLRDTLACFTTDVIGAASFGVRGESVRTNFSPLRRITRELATFSWRRGIEFSSIFFIPSIVDIFGFKFFTPSMSTSWRNIFWKIAEERSNDTMIKHKDLMGTLLQIREDAQRGSNTEFTDDALVAQAAVFVQGGFDTTGVFISFFMYEIAHNPAIQQRLYQELIDANCLADGVMDYNIVKELPYLSMCFKETLRKYPPMGFLDRVADQEYKVDENLTIPKGTPVYVNAIGMHYNDKYFPEPKKFDPERFSSENEPLIKPFTYLPFGEGPRICIGMRFALQSASTLVTHILLNFEIRPKQGRPTPDQIGLEPKSVFLGPAQIFDVQFVERKSSVK